MKLKKKKIWIVGRIGELVTMLLRLLIKITAIAKQMLCVGRQNK